jgi:hypothetical protein
MISHDKKGRDESLTRASTTAGAELLRKLQKLRGCSFDEVRVRGAQAFASLMERHGLSAAARLPDDATLFAMIDGDSIEARSICAESLLAHFRARHSPKFFPSFHASEETRAALRRRFAPGAQKSVVQRAQCIEAGRFDLLGQRNLDFGAPVDWHLEPTARKRPPLVHWSRIDYLNPEVAGDKKFIWELNRQQYFLLLGRAYWHTGDERYARTFATHLAAWMEANPPKLGINWASSLEVAFRSISWLWALYFFKDSPHLTPSLFLRALKFLYVNARHLETYLSTYFSPNTHLTGEALGLFYLGTLLPELRPATRWRATGQAIMLAALEQHVLPDGVYFEQSTYYHRYTADFYTHLYLLMRENGALPGSPLTQKMIALLDHLTAITKPDGTTPYFGDDDGGQLVKLGERAANDFRGTLATGAALFARADYKYVAEEAAEETLWLLGARGLDAFDCLEAQAPSWQSRAFRNGGYFVMRDGWTRESNYLLIDCGPHGAAGGAHAHADALAFEAAVQGRTMLVDPGTYTYTGAASARDRFRTTAAHNALTVDGESSSVPGGTFSWAHVARCTLRTWVARERVDFFEGEHDGYERLAAPVKHIRSILFIKDDYWIVRDRLETSGAHKYELHFHFAAQSEPSIETPDGSACIRERSRGDNASGLDLYTFARTGAWRRHDELISTCYGASTAAPVCTYSLSGGAEDIVTLLVPRAMGAAQFSAHEIEAVGGRGFLLKQGTTRDYLLIRAGDAQTVEAARLASDFAWTWLRFRDDETEPCQVVALDGRSLHLDNREVARSAARINYLAACRAGEELKVETDAGADLFLAPLGARRITVNDGREIASQPGQAEREKCVLSNK